MTESGLHKRVSICLVYWYFINAGSNTDQSIKRRCMIHRRDQLVMWKVLFVTRVIMFLSLVVVSFYKCWTGVYLIYLCFFMLTRISSMIFSQPNFIRTSHLLFFVFLATFDLFWNLNIAFFKTRISPNMQARL